MRGRLIQLMLGVLIVGSAACGAKDGPPEIAGPRVACGLSDGIPTSVFDGPARALGSSQPDRVVADSPTVRPFAESPTRWRTFESGDELAYLGGDPPSIQAVTLKRGSGEWKWTGGGGCVTFLRTDRAVATWQIPAAGVAPDATSFTITVSDRQCASGAPASERGLRGKVAESDTAVIITITARPLSGNQTCPGHASTTQVITLLSPLGNRTLLDGAIYPPQPPCQAGEAHTDESRNQCAIFF